LWTALKCKSVMRYIVDPDGKSCECALVVADAWQQLGIGSVLLAGIERAARSAGIRRMWAAVLHDNHKMLSLADKADSSARRIRKIHGSRGSKRL
jgi:acetyltransferase